MGTQALVACTDKLLLVDLTTHDLEVVEDHRGEYYGISWPYDGQSLCLGHSGVDNSKLLNFEDYANSQRGWISLGDRATDRFLSAPHQILCVDDLVVGSNTGRNCIALVRLHDLFYRQHWLDEIRWDRTSPQSPRGSHFNSFYFHNRRFYVVAHNHDRPSKVFVLAWPALTLIEKWDLDASGAHNIWPSHNTFLVCDSMRGRILDARSQTVLWETTATCGILRGVAQNGNHLWIGGSAFASRSGRKAADGAIFLLDADAWQLRDTIDLPACGAVHEIRLLHKPDVCHHGYPLLLSIAGDPAATARHHERIMQVREHLAKIRGWTIHDGDVVTARDDEVRLIDELFTIATFDAPPPWIFKFTPGSPFRRLKSPAISAWWPVTADPATRTWSPRFCTATKACSASKSGANVRGPG
jgi:hypothetical protein